MLPTLNSWHVDAHKLLTMGEIDKVLAALRQKAATSKTAQANLILFRLLTTLGLRISEALGITLDNVRLDCDQPHVIVPASVAKLARARTVPIWSAQAVEELKAFKQLRRDMGAQPSDTYFCSLSKGESYGQPIARQVAGRRYKTMMKMALSEERATELHPHSSRHTFISACLSRGVSLVETQRAAGHSNLQTTTIYSHLFIDRNSKSYSLD